MTSGEAAGILLLNQESAESFDLESQLPDDTSFTYASIGKGYFDELNVFHGEILALPEQFVIAARGSEGSLLKVRVLDRNHRAAEFLLQLRPIDQNFTLDFSAAHVPPAFDPSQTAQILLIQDGSLTQGLSNSLVQIHIKGLNYIPATLDTELQALKTSLIQDGLAYFKTGVGIDSATHFPYDSITAEGIVEADAKFTQPTSIGFYAQILGDVVNGKTENGLTIGEALTELNAVTDSLLDAQQQFGWNGLLPWLSLNPYGTYTDWVGLGDNANLAQSLAVMVGSLEMAALDAEQRGFADTIAAKVETFLDRQLPGYQAKIGRAHV